jgi:hypothetical protein
MNRFINLLNIFTKQKHKLLLGRWGVKCDMAKGKIADYANVDHCGPCGVDNIILSKEIKPSNHYRYKVFVKKY